MRTCTLVSLLLFVGLIACGKRDQVTPSENPSPTLDITDEFLSSANGKYVSKNGEELQIDKSARVFLFHTPSFQTKKIKGRSVRNCSDLAAKDECQCEYQYPSGIETLVCFKLEVVQLPCSYSAKGLIQKVERRPVFENGLATGRNYVTVQYEIENSKLIFLDSNVEMAIGLPYMTLSLNEALHKACTNLRSQVEDNKFTSYEQNGDTLEFLSQVFQRVLPIP